MGNYIEIINMSKRLNEYIVKLRREFHMYPELAFEEYRTSRIVESELKSMGLDIVRVADTGVVGVLKGGGKGGVVALRTAIDAVPIDEELNVPYKSKIPGKMHACGNDANMAILIGTAKVLTYLKDRIKGIVKFIFQPASEVGLGAKEVVKSGLIDDVNAILALRVWIELESGVIGIKEGSVTPNTDLFIVKVRGRPASTALPHLAIDPIPIAIDLINTYYKLISKELRPNDLALINITQLRAGIGFNTIAKEVEVRGSLKTSNISTRNYIVKKLAEITRNYARTFKTDADFILTENFVPSVKNSKRLAKFVRRVISSTHLTKVIEHKQTLLPEDFSYYLTKCEGLLIFLGIYNRVKKTIYPHHHPRFNVDEDILWIGTAALALTTYYYLNSLST